MLLALLSGQRIQTLRSFSIDHLHITENAARFQIQTLLKQSRPGYHLSTVSFSRYEEDNNLCVVTHLKQYIRERVRIN